MTAIRTMLGASEILARVPVAEGSLHERRSRIVLSACLVLITVVGTSNFNPILLGDPPGTTTSIQQYLTVAIWAGIIGAGIFIPPRIRIGPWLDICLAIAFFAYVVLSATWSDDLTPSLLKATAFTVTTLGAFVIASALSVAVIVDCVTLGLACLAAGSIALVVFVPSIGIISSWMHNGQWSGLYESKQSLGSIGAFLMFFAFCGYRIRGRWLVSGIAFLLGAAAVIGSGSRGAGAIALAAIVCVLAASFHAIVPRILAFVPILCIAFATRTLFDLKSSGNPYLVLLGEKTDLTERVVIWQHALSRLDERIWFGYGLNGFWTNGGIYYAFLRQHGWVLDNFHSGYLAILVETGLVGTTLFAAVFTLYALRMLTLTGQRILEASELNTIISFIALVFLFDLTETIFLRSTTSNSTLLTVFLFASAAAVPGPTGARRRGGRP